MTQKKPSGPKPKKINDKQNKLTENKAELSENSHSTADIAPPPPAIPIGMRPIYSDRRLTSTQTTRHPKIKLMDRVTIIAGIVAIIGLLPQFYDLARSLLDREIYPQKALNIASFEVYADGDLIRPVRPGIDLNTTYIQSSEQWWDTLTITCVSGETPDCEHFIYLGVFEDTPRIEMNLANKALDGTPLIIEGLEVTLIDYTPITTPKLDALYIHAAPDSGGPGGGASNFFYLHNLSSTNEHFLSVNHMIFDPQTSLNKPLNLSPACEQESGGCREELVIKTEEVQEVKLFLDALRDIPSGHYKFQLSVLFSREKRSYKSEQSAYFGFTKAEQINVWEVSQNNHTQKASPPFFALNINTGVLQDLLPSLKLNDAPNGYLHVNGRDAIGEIAYTVSLKSGEIKNMVRFQASSPFHCLWETCLSSPDGLKVLTPLAESETDWNIDIGLFDLRSFTSLNLTPHTSLTRELSPSWSPSGKHIAYIKLVRNNDGTSGQADIFIYDMEKKESTQVTYTPDAIESFVAWVDEDHLVYYMPQYPFYDPMISGDSKRPILNAQMGIGELNLKTGGIRSLRSTLPATSSLYTPLVMTYLHESKAFLTTQGELITTDGRLLPSIPGMSEQNIILDTDPLRVAKHVSNGIVLYTHGNDEEVLIMERLPREEIIDVPLFLGEVNVGGIAIADSINDVIYQYDAAGRLIRQWQAPYLELLAPYISPPFKLILTE